MSLNRPDRIYPLGIAMLLSATPAFANDLPTVNLGLTSFLDGALPAGPGVYYQNYLEDYGTSRFQDDAGHKAPLPRQDLNIVADISQLTYYSSQTIGPGRIGWDLVVPTLASAQVKDGLGGKALNAHTGLGDILFGPIFQFEPAKGPFGWTWLQSLEFDVLAPTGAYDRTKVINAGNNAWALDPFYAVTVMPTAKLSVSARLHYLYNFTNDHPSVAYGAGARSVQAGQAFHADFAAAYAVSPRLSLGLNGYYLRQTTDTDINDAAAPGRREQVLGLGPGLVFAWSPATYLFANAYVESEARNRTQGDRLVVRAVHHF
jgi:hypothetical protein